MYRIEHIVIPQPPPPPERPAVMRLSNDDLPKFMSKRKRGVVWIGDDGEIT